MQKKSKPTDESATSGKRSAAPASPAGGRSSRRKSGDIHVEAAPKSDRILTERAVMRAFAEEEPGQPVTFKSLARRLALNDKHGRQLLTDQLAELIETGQLIQLENNVYALRRSTKAAAIPDLEHRQRSPRESADIISGRVDLANQKFAFVVSDDSATDVRVFTDRLQFAMQGDLVRVRLRPQRRPDPRAGRGRRGVTSDDDRPTGEVIEIIQRKRETLVGRVVRGHHETFVVPDFRKMYFDVVVDPRDLNGANDGDKVLVRVTKWPDDPSFAPVGVVEEVFGPAGQHNAEMHAILAEFDLPSDFPEEVEAEAEAISDVISEEEIARRRDFRDVLTFTIDPADAKDFDDALSLRHLPNGHVEVGVHIADVTHYVKPGSRLEEEAERRATSVYLVDRVVPMLPERLSNGLCSLRPNETKCTFSAVFELDLNGKLHNEWFGRTVIHSARRFSYEEAQERIETGNGDLAEEINLLNSIAKNLQAERFRRGAISFETTEVKFRLDEEGRPISVYVKERKDAHKLIEEFMLMANKRVAEFVFQMKRKGQTESLPMVYRVHDAPDTDRLSTFAQFVHKLGYKLDPEGDVSAELNRLTEKSAGKPEADMLQTLAVRTMAKAIYTTRPDGHFGLAFAHYSHFTSPIRRYPDMMAHRLLAHYLAGGPAVDKDELELQSRHSSEMEKRAADAERASIKYKQVEYMQAAVGQEFTGVVSGVTEWGMFVEIEENKCEGMIRLADIPGEYFELDKDNYRLVSRKSGRVIRFGDKVRVKVMGANLTDRTIDLALVRL
jgi:ribonuclease R